MISGFTMTKKSRRFHTKALDLLKTYFVIQKYSRNVQQWIELLGNYDWNHLIQNVDDINFEKFIDQTFYPTLINLDASTGFSKLKSKQ